MTLKNLVIADKYDLGRLNVEARDYFARRQIEGVEVSLHDDGIKAKENMLEIERNKGMFPVVIMDEVLNGRSGSRVYMDLKPEQRNLVTIVTRDPENFKTRIAQNIMTDPTLIPTRVYKKGTNEILSEATMNEILDFYFKPKPTDIVYAEDYEGMREVTALSIEMYLQEKAPGVQLTSVEDGKQAYDVIEDLVKKGRRPVLVTDNNMPNMTGLELIRAVYGQVQGVIVTTALPDKFLESLGDTPVTAVLTKPFEKDYELEETLDKFFGN